MVREKDGKGWTKAICWVLGSVCHGAGPFAGALTWPSQLHFHFMDEDTKSQRFEPTYFSVSKRQILTAESRAEVLALC